MEALLSRFTVSGRPAHIQPYGNGHIHRTYLVICEDGRRYFLQKINTAVFTDPEALMQNIRLVTAHLSARCESARESLRLVPARDGAFYARLESGCWRVYEAVPDSLCLERAETPRQFAESAAAFGRFVRRLSDFDPSLLAETIPHFHDTPGRLSALKAAVRADCMDRVKTALPEIEAAFAREDFAGLFSGLQARGELPLRVTHNDTKINNVLFDQASLAGLCVIDLDTVMPGLIMNDFGDAIRFGANTAEEDEPALERVSLDLGLYEAYLRAYLHACGDCLSPLEIELLPAGAKMMTYECGVRFLTDYLCGDHYFHVDEPLHNLRRARTQFRLLADMERQWDAMRRIAAAAGN
ncbi:MAG: aminoglycoside phosphotransferase family protein [Clostridia bacterium]|nr:aminoglycoside phosphotransferase family protein [Clostridia bacterium]